MTRPTPSLGLLNRPREGHVGAAGLSRPLPLRRPSLPHCPCEDTRGNHARCSSAPCRTAGAPLPAGPRQPPGKRLFGTPLAWLLRAGSDQSWADSGPPMAGGHCNDRLGALCRITGHVSLGLPRCTDAGARSGDNLPKVTQYVRGTTRTGTPTFCGTFQVHTSWCPEPLELASWTLGKSQGQGKGVGVPPCRHGPLGNLG